MKLRDAVESLQGRIIHSASAFDSAEIRHVVASDLMSDVLVVDHSSLLLVTSLASDQALRTAHIVGAPAVVVTNGKALPSSMKTLAAELDVALILSPLSKFHACVALGRLVDGKP